ncbi:protein memo1 [Anaeramoeba flamelloides]|uniref:Protein memo1 n=1 Tax=Anaeramoeba flamelloides TaxID=1746091 RepID=A0ABQ8YUA4_9EUKA|nr:protein memo1 [Anaeramoeba flamelloides]
MRRATHAYSWYSGNSNHLKREIISYLEKATNEYSSRPIKGMICPHAGFAYSAPTAAYAWKNVQANDFKEKIERVFLLGNSHSAYTQKCLLSSATSYETPFGNLQIDTKIVSEILENEMFGQMSMEVDENEHSIEMHLPFVAHVLGTEKIKIVPILVGQIPNEKKLKYGEFFKQYLEMENSLFVVSSDFCHWGRRFQYTTTIKSEGNEKLPIYKSIEKIDRLGMDAIESLIPEKFNNYIDEYRNTICGKHPIGILMAASNPEVHQLKFVNYSQSSKVTSKSDSSVSYASAVLFEK